MTHGHALHGRMDAVLRQQHVAKPMLDLLQMLVANCVDTDSFKQSASVRLGVVEGLVRQPTSEIAAARAETTAALESMQRNVATLEKKFRATYDALRGEADLRIAEISEAARSISEDAGLARRDAQNAFAQHVDSLRDEADAVLSLEVAKAKHAVGEARDNAIDVARQRLDALQVSVVEETGTSLSELAADASRCAVEACDGARGQLAAKLNEGENRLASAASAAAHRVSSALETLNALPLLEVHRLSANVALLEARIDVIDVVASNARVDGLATRLGDVERRAARCELREDQVNDKVDALAAEVAGGPAPSTRSALAPATLSQSAAEFYSEPTSPSPSFRGAHHSKRTLAATAGPGSPLAERMRAEDRRQTVRALGEELSRTDTYEGDDALFTPGGSSAAARRPPPHHGGGGGRDGSPPRDLPSSGGTGSDHPHRQMRTLLRLQSRIDALEASTLTAKQSSDRAFALVKRMGQLLDETVVSRIEVIHDSVAAVHRILGLSPEAVLALHRNQEEELEALDSSIQQRAHASGAGTSGRPTVAPEAAMLRRAARHIDGDADLDEEGLIVERLSTELRHRVEAARALWASPTFATFATALPSLGVELAESGPPLGGVRIVSVVPDGVADRGGLEPDDVVLRVGPAPVCDRETFAFATKLSISQRPLQQQSSSSARSGRLTSCVVEVAAYRPTVGSMVCVQLPL